MRISDWSSDVCSSDLRVLDAACGEGFGSALLARAGAHSVLGVDIADSAITHARSRYGAQPVLSFARADVCALDAFPDNSFDLIVSFETLEHEIGRAHV